MKLTVTLRPLVTSAYLVKAASSRSRQFVYSSHEGCDQCPEEREDSVSPRPQASTRRLTHPHAKPTNKARTSGAWPGQNRRVSVMMSAPTVASAPIAASMRVELDEGWEDRGWDQCRKAVDGSWLKDVDMGHPRSVKRGTRPLRGTDGKQMCG